MKCNGQYISLSLTVAILIMMKRYICDQIIFNITVDNIYYATYNDVGLNVFEVQINLLLPVLILLTLSKL